MAPLSTRANIPSAMAPTLRSHSLKKAANLPHIQFKKRNFHPRELEIIDNTLLNFAKRKETPYYGNPISGSNTPG